MKVSDIVNAYCERNGLKVLQGRLGENDPAPIVAFMIMDCAQAEYMKNIAPLNLKHDAKKLDSMWRKDYHAFNQRLFTCLTPDQRDFTIEMMDAYTEAVDYEVMLIRIAVMDLVKICDFADQKIIASLLLCNVFSQIAQICWGAVYRNDYSKEDKCPELLRLRQHSHKLSNTVVILPVDINPNASEKLMSAVESFKNKTIKWLDGYGK